jgi:hypothetical protein
MYACVRLTWTGAGARFLILEENLSWVALDKSTFTAYLGARPSCILKPALPAPVLLWNWTGDSDVQTRASKIPCHFTSLLLGKRNRYECVCGANVGMLCVFTIPCSKYAKNGGSVK